MQKRTTPTDSHAAYIRRAGFSPHKYTVIKELNYTLFIRHRVTGEVKMISKGI